MKKGKKTAITQQQRKRLKLGLTERMKVRRRKEEERRQQYYK